MVQKVIGKETHKIDMNQTHARISRFIRNHQNRYKENNVRHQTIHKSTFHVPIKQRWAVAAIVSTMSKSLTISSLSVSKMGSNAYALGNWPNARSCTDRQSIPTQKETEDRNKCQRLKIMRNRNNMGIKVVSTCRNKYFFAQFTRKNWKLTKIKRLAVLHFCCIRKPREHIVTCTINTTFFATIITTSSSSGGCDNRVVLSGKSSRIKAFQQVIGCDGAALVRADAGNHLIIRYLKDKDKVRKVKLNKAWRQMWSVTSVTATTIDRFHRDR